MTAGVKTLIVIFSFGMIVASFLIGWVAKRKVTSAQAYFGGTGLFGPFVVGFSTMAAVASAFAIVGIPGIIYSTGNTMTFWMLSSAAFAMAYMILGKKVRAMAELGPVASLGDISDLRFNNNRAIKAIMSIVLFLGCVAYLASQIKACSTLFAHLLGWNPILAGFVIFGVLTIYTAISGEVGGILTQAFQGLVMVIAGVIMIVAFFSITKGFGPLLEVVSTAGKVTDGEITKVFSADILNAWGVFPGSVAMAWMIIPILGTIGQPQVLTRMYALKNPKDMPKLGLYASLSHMIVGFFAVVMGYGALFLVGKGLIKPLASGDQAVFAFADYVGVHAQLFVYAAVLAAAMSSASLFLSLTSGIISRDLPSAFGYRFSSEKQMKISRITIFVLGVLSILFALTSSEMVAILGTFGWGTLMSATFPVFIIGLLWKKASSQGVLAGLITALGLNIISLILVRTGFKWPGALPWYVNVITASIAVTVFISLFTKGATEEDLDERVKAVIDL
ncbi:Na+/proline symporter [Paramaledivibacter caminithermalis DSM 15212]|uniref:Na+/proline symporter n=1 Tax=Paramaledivibacter caminithermalis (strain DSM 15212 / CIP 107654 / DViRD3) TaxID=1121301 RepID=A0A1M6MCQ6_PARC5|nr:Na+/proline symporter [Paramaledivibacter caminithermalis DSM 15212]